MPDLPLVKFSFYQGEERVLTGQVDVIGAHPSARAMGPQKRPAKAGLKSKMSKRGDGSTITDGDASGLRPSLRRSEPASVIGGTKSRIVATRRYRHVVSSSFRR
jgi:hypothetical protein